MSATSTAGPSTQDQGGTLQVSVRGRPEVTLLFSQAEHIAQPTLHLLDGSILHPTHGSHGRLECHDSPVAILELPLPYDTFVELLVADMVHVFELTTSPKSESGAVDEELPLADTLSAVQVRRITLLSANQVVLSRMRLIGNLSIRLSSLADHARDEHRGVHILKSDLTRTAVIESIDKVPVLIEQSFLGSLDVDSCAGSITLRHVRVQQGATVVTKEGSIYMEAISAPFPHAFSTFENDIFNAILDQTSLRSQVASVPRLYLHATKGDVTLRACPALAAFVEIHALESAVTVGSISIWGGLTITASESGSISCKHAAVLGQVRLSAKGTISIEAVESTASSWRVRSDEEATDTTLTDLLALVAYDVRHRSSAHVTATRLGFLNGSAAMTEPWSIDIETEGELTVTDVHVDRPVKLRCLTSRRHHVGAAVELPRGINIATSSFSSHVDVRSDGALRANFRASGDVDLYAIKMVAATIDLCGDLTPAGSNDRHVATTEAPGARLDQIVTCTSRAGVCRVEVKNWPTSRRCKATVQVELDRRNFSSRATLLLAAPVPHLPHARILSNTDRCQSLESSPFAVQSR